MDSLLFGHNPQARIVAVQQVSDNTMRVYSRTSAGVSHEDFEYFPFLFLSDPSYLRGFGLKHWIRQLAGNNYFRFLCAFTGWSEMWDAVHHIIDIYATSLKARIESYTELPVLYLRPDPVSQFLIQSGRTLFKGMTFDQVYRLQIDIETYAKHGFRYSNADRPEDRVIAIALSDSNGWEHLINGKHFSEKEMLLELIRIIAEKDPDVIEGHNIVGFDLPYLLRRCSLHGIEFSVGRNGAALRSSDSRTASTDRTTDAALFDIPGRHIIDTMLLLQSYDIAQRKLESYGLKYAARHFGFASDTRTYVAGDKISWHWDHEPDTLLRYALDDVREAKQLSDRLSPSYFYLTQIVPYNYGTTVRIGSSAKIESMMVREYVRQRHSLPRPEAGIQTTGGYADIFWTGVLSPILHIDIESLYPSIMITEQIAPRSDALGTFLSLLRNLRRMRLDAKHNMKTAGGQAERETLDATQSSLKILINSFYGYLGYARALFNDFHAADEVTRSGQRILKQLIAEIRKGQGIVVEVDTDGILFVPPPGVHDEQAESDFVQSIAAVLLPEINLRIEGRYRKMLSYKKKNYALQGYDNTVTIVGSSLVSRSTEPFGKRFIRQCAEALLAENIEGLHQLYINVHKDISEHKLSVADFAKTETLRDTPETYSNEVDLGKRNRSASYEAALSAGGQWKAGDKISYYIVGNEMSVKEFEHSKPAEEWDANFPDENIAHYLKRLDELTNKFELFFAPQDFRAIFSLDDLFPFSPQGITIMTKPIDTVAGLEEEPDDMGPPEPTIWLSEG